MARNPYTQPAGPPPNTVSEARNRRQRTRACGLSPNHWYAMEFSRALRAGDTKEVTFWRRPIALYRGQDGAVRALENRCAHRQVKLSEGEVHGCQLVCPYHGWRYDGDGRVASVPHELFGRERLPSFTVPSFPVRERYGLIWVFPGDAALADTVPLPHIPEIEGADPWHYVPIDFTWGAHHSMVIDNVSDYTHGWLHRKYEPFSDPVLTRCETVGDAVHVEYDTRIGAGKVINAFINRGKVDSNRIHLVYDYPYHTSNTDDFIKHFICTVPIDERTSRVFFLFYYKSLTIPFTRLPIPRALMKPAIELGNRLLVRPLLQQDGDVLELEQQGWEAQWDAPLAELNPIVRAFQDLTIRKWQEYEDSTRHRARAATRHPADTPCPADTPASEDAEGSPTHGRQHRSHLERARV